MLYLRYMDTLYLRYKDMGSTSGTRTCSILGTWTPSTSGTRTWLNFRYKDMLYLRY